MINTALQGASSNAGTHYSAKLTDANVLLDILTTLGIEVQTVSLVEESSNSAMCLH